MLYSIALVDRINLGVAREAGMGEQLVCCCPYTSDMSDFSWAGQKLTTGNRYSIISCLYFVPYILL